MKYVLADKQKAVQAGFLEVAHRTNELVMLLNENEVRHTDKLSGTLAERVEALDGQLLTQAETFIKIKRKGKYKLI